MDLTSLLVGLVLTAEPCADALSKGRAKLEKVPLPKRIRPTLELIGASCGAVDVALAEAATKAAKKPRAQRAPLLAAGQKACAVPDPLAPAKSIAEACPPREGDPTGPVLEHLDAGTYAFVVALRARLRSDAGTGASNADLVLSSLVLAVALEGETLLKGGR